MRIFTNQYRRNDRQLMQRRMQIEAQIFEFLYKELEKYIAVESDMLTIIDPKQKTSISTIHPQLFDQKIQVVLANQHIATKKNNYAEAERRYAAVRWWTSAIRKRRLHQSYVESHNQLKISLENCLQNQLASTGIKPAIQIKNTSKLKVQTTPKPTILGLFSQLYVNKVGQWKLTGCSAERFTQLMQAIENQQSKLVRARVKFAAQDDFWARLFKFQGYRNAQQEYRQAQAEYEVALSELAAQQSDVEKIFNRTAGHYNAAPKLAVKFNSPSEQIIKQQSSFTINAKKLPKTNDEYTFTGLAKQQSLSRTRSTSISTQNANGHIFTLVDFKYNKKLLQQHSQQNKRKICFDIVSYRHDNQHDFEKLVSLYRYNGKLIKYHYLDDNNKIQTGTVKDKKLIKAFENAQGKIINFSGEMKSRFLSKYTTSKIDYASDEDLSTKNCINLEIVGW